MHLKMIAFWTILVLWVSGCDRDTLLTDHPTALQEIQFYLAPGDSAQKSPTITSIELKVSWPDMEPQTYTVRVINQEEHTATRQILVPIGKEVTISAKAYEGDYAVRSGSLKITVNEGDNNTITIPLDLIPIVISLQAVQDRVSAGTPLVLEVYLNDAPELFGFTCELEFNPNLLKPEGVTPGDFFGKDVLYLMVAEKKYWTNTPPGGGELREEANGLSLGITRKAGAAGVRGSGVVFRITFGTTSAGDAAIGLVRNDKLELRTPDPDFEKIEDSRIQIEQLSAPIKIE